MSPGATFRASLAQRALRSGRTLCELQAAKPEVTVAVVVAADGLLPVVEE